MKIPFLDLIAPHVENEEELVRVFRTAILSGQFVGGQEVESFEREFAGYCGTTECVAVDSGTDALLFALSAAGIGKGDLVLTVPNTFIATTEAISQSGAIFDFIDVDERTSTMDPERLREYLERPSAPRVKAVVPVHLYGQMADMDPILALAEKHGFTVIEDACQAHGAEYFSRRQRRWCRAGSMGKAAAFSFYPGKNLGACGEGGAVTTSDNEIAARIRMLRDHGQSAKYYHDLEGYNGRLDSIQCGILRVKLRKLDQGNEKRRKAAELYRSLLAEAPGIVTPDEPEWSRGVFHLYVIRTSMRNELQIHLTGRGIGTGLHYPVPLHMQKCYADRHWKSDDYPVARTMAESILSLPMFPQLSPAQQAYVAGQILAFSPGAPTGIPTTIQPASASYPS